MLGTIKLKPVKCPDCGHTKHTKKKINNPVKGKQTLYTCKNCNSSFIKHRGTYV